MSARADPRFSRDVDVCVVVSGDDEAEQVIHRLMGLGYAVDTIVEHEHVQRLATSRLASPDGAHLRALRPFVGAADAEEVRRLVALVVDRQFHRGRDLGRVSIR